MCSVISGKFEPRIPAAAVSQDTRETGAGYVGMKDGRDYLRVMYLAGKTFSGIAVSPVLLKCYHDDWGGTFNELLQDTFEGMMKEAEEDLLEHGRVATGTSLEEAMKMELATITRVYEIAKALAPRIKEWATDAKKGLPLSGVTDNKGSATWLQKRQYCGETMMICLGVAHEIWHCVAASWVWRESVCGE